MTFTPALAHAAAAALTVAGLLAQPAPPRPGPVTAGTTAASSFAAFPALSPATAAPAAAPGTHRRAVCPARAAGAGPAALCGGGAAVTRLRPAAAARPPRPSLPGRGVHETRGRRIGPTDPLRFVLAGLAGLGVVVVAMAGVELLGFAKRRKKRKRR
ncbi:hypothetical protein [Bailinhaonella thermotolerans]|uniref:Uncharacterized protein n=1 Tax=Bailinhaonella thermotolerans TaxID=1070861 RepID=A0A3A4AX26_9ACTN|nr:hypothetical protein [Bailinhaonella thermotolerans]RJL23982.1 hypothetical protein D5H75_31610 [Bailinhaonella thermotolerans]